jgi:hypothetical protein
VTQFSPAAVESFKAFLAEGDAKAWDCKTTSMAATKAIRGGAPDVQGEVADAAFRFVDKLIIHAMQAPGGFQWGGPQHRKGKAVAQLAATLLKKTPPLQAAATRNLLERFGAIQSHYAFSAAAVLDALQRHVDEHGLDASTLRAAKRFEGDLRGSPKHMRRLGELLRREPDRPPGRLEPRDAWTYALSQYLAGSSQRLAFERLLAHCGALTSATPSATWRETARALVEGLGSVAHQEATTIIVEAIGTAAPFPVHVPSTWNAEQVVEADPTTVAEASADALRGWIWSTLGGTAASQIDALGSAAVRCFEKLPGVGPRSPKVGNAITNVLAEVGTFPAVSQLSRIKRSAKHASAKRQVDKAIARAAEVAGVGPLDFEELATPTHGFTNIGTRDTVVGRSKAHLRLLSGRTVGLTWTNAAGKTQKSVPSAVRAEHPEAASALRKERVDVEQTLTTLRGRLEGHLRTPRPLPLADWRARYLDHPLAGWLTRRLIWRFGDDGPLGMVHGDGFADVDGAAIRPNPAARVRLWHPIESAAEDVLRWRQRLVAEDITQPFKQAHREIYVLTDAERETDVYSNRFASHILQQHQFAALCRERGWTFGLMGDFEPDDFPFLAFPKHPWRAELTLAIPAALDERTAAGISVYVATHQLRFVKPKSADAVSLSEIPPLVFSEVMRDVDLFVAVSSVGNDPQWRDTGPRGELESYWHDYAFGPLGLTAATRRAVLEQLLPRLQIGQRCRLHDRFLEVRGNLRSYKIHLGSANVLMSPNDEYLCVVPGRDRAAARRVKLPFEGDGVLTIILSKAMWLAEDDAIDDPAVVSQLQRRG